jgi:hypothetical protein
MGQFSSKTLNMAFVEVTNVSHSPLNSKWWLELVKLTGIIIIKGPIKLP